MLSAEGEVPRGIMQRYYKYQYRFNASHCTDACREHAHMHSFTIELYVSKPQQGEQILFFDMDDMVNQYLDRYNQKYLNDLEPFGGVLPSLENMGDLFFEELLVLLGEKGITLYQLDICENPLRVYQVSTRLHLPMSVVRP